MADLRYLLLFFSLLKVPDAAIASPLIQPVTKPTSIEASPAADGAVRMVGAILEYTRWPSNLPVVRLCLVGAARYAGRFNKINLSSGAKIELLNLRTAGADMKIRCDVLYFGRLELDSLRHFVAATRGKPVVTIAEDDPDCRSGVMFCMRLLPQVSSFQLNIDAVSRSGVQIDPRVLRISRGNGAR